MIPVYSLRKSKLVPIGCFEDLGESKPEERPVDAQETIVVDAEPAKEPGNGDQASPKPQ